MGDPRDFTDEELGQLAQIQQAIVIRELRDIDKKENTHVDDVLMRMRCNIVVAIAILLHTHQWPEMSLHVCHQDRHIG